MDSNPESIAQRHARWIALGGLLLGLVTAAAAGAALWRSDLHWLLAGLIVALTALVATAAWSLIVAQILVRRFVTSYRAAALRLEPTTPSEETQDDASWLTANGFDYHGSWMTVGADGEVFGGVGSRLFHRSDHAISAYLDRTQVGFTSDLSDGRTLVTTDTGALSHPLLIVQGERGADVDVLYDLHCTGLRHLHAQGISAVEPAGGPLATRLRSDTREQEHLNGISVSAGARKVLASPSSSLAPLAPLG